MKNWWYKKFKKQIGEIKKITRKFLTETNLSNGKKQKIHQKNLYAKKINWISGAALVASAAAPPATPAGATAPPAAGRAAARAADPGYGVEGKGDRREEGKGRPMEGERKR